MRVVSGCSPVLKSGHSDCKDPQKAQAKKENLKTVREENAELSAGSGLARRAAGKMV